MSRTGDSIGQIMLMGLGSEVMKKLLKFL